MKLVYLIGETEPVKMQKTWGVLPQDALRKHMICYRCYIVNCLQPGLLGSFLLFVVVDTSFFA